MPGFLREVRYALRALAATPAFVAIAVLTLALGIGANTAIFSMVDAVLLRPLPYPEPGQLVSVREQDATFPSMSDSLADYQDWAAQNHSFTYLAAFRNASSVLTNAGPPITLPGIQATWQYFKVLGVAPERGRTFLPSEDRWGAPGVVVLSDQLWRERFGAAPNIMGQVIDLDDKPRTVIGIMPPGFPGLAGGRDAVLFWTSLTASLDPKQCSRGCHPGIDGLGRLKPGVTLAMARADLAGIMHNLAQQYPKSNSGETTNVESYLARVVRNDGPTALWMLLAAVGLVLLIACSNVANLLLARATTRQKANAIRAALGATRTRLIREHLIESLCLAVAGAGLGLLLAALAMRAVPLLIPAGLGMTRADQVALDGRVLGFAIFLALATSLLFGLVPAWQASRGDIVETLKEGGRESSQGAAGHRARGVLVGVQMALAVVLLVGAGLLVRSLLRLQRVDPGFRPQGILSFSIGLPDAKYPKREQAIEFFHQATVRMRQLPGVQSVGTIYPLPFSGNDWENSFTVVGQPEPPPGHGPSANFAYISGDALPALGIRLLRGRAFDDRDTMTSPPVAMIDTTFAKRYWPAPPGSSDPLSNALGKQISMDKTKPPLTVVGIFARVMNYGLEAATEMDRLPEMYVPLSQSSDATDSYIVVRTAMSDPLQLRPEAAAIVQSLDPNVPIDDALTMDQRVALSLAQRRLTLWLMIGFAALAMILAAIGIYGVLSYAVAQRRHEIGVRMALGASQQRVRALVLREGLRLTGWGAMAGLVAALLAGRYAASFLYGVSWADPVTLLGAPALLLATAALACYVPARRATRIDPMIALRGE